MLSAELGNNKIYGLITERYPLGFATINVEVKHYRTTVEIIEIITECGNSIGRIIYGGQKATKTRKFKGKVFDG